MVPREEDKTSHVDITVSTDASEPADIELSPVQLRRHKSEYSSQTELSQIGANSDFPSSPTHKRYSSPLFQGILGKPIEAVRISTQSIPDDGSFENLIQTANLVTRSGSKTPEIKAPVESTTNKTNELSEEALDEILSDNISDPEKVLMENVVPGKM